MDKQIQAIAEGGAFDVAEAIRLLAQFLVAKGLVVVEVEGERNAGSASGRGKKK